jgi:hypothetical protein
MRQPLEAAMTIAENLAPGVDTIKKSEKFSMSPISGRGNGACFVLNTLRNPTENLKFTYTI